MIIDYIMSALITSLGTSVVPSGHIYYDRANQPTGFDSFPYIRVFIEQTSSEPTTTATTTAHNYFNTYSVKIEIWTTQVGTDDQVGTQGTLQRALESILNFIPPNTAWGSITNFCHLTKIGSPTLTKNDQLYLGKDVYTSVNQWSLLVVE